MQQGKGLQQINKSIPKVWDSRFFFPYLPQNTCSE